MVVSNLVPGKSKYEVKIASIINSASAKLVSDIQCSTCGDNDCNNIFETIRTL